MELAQGKLPPRLTIPFPDELEVNRKVRKAIGIALKLTLSREVIGIALKSTLSNGEKLSLQNQQRAKQTVLNMILLQNKLSQGLYLFTADVRGSEDYLLGFNFLARDKFAIGLSLELIHRLYDISPTRLAQYIFHECVPEKGIITERNDHRTIYNEIQSAIFGEDEVRALRDDLREFIDEKAAAILSPDQAPAQGGLRTKPKSNTAEKGLPPDARFFITPEDRLGKEPAPGQAPAVVRLIQNIGIFSRDDVIDVLTNKLGYAAVVTKGLRIFVSEPDGSIIIRDKDASCGWQFSANGRLIVVIDKDKVATVLDLEDPAGDFVAAAKIDDTQWPYEVIEFPSDVLIVDRSGQERVLDVKTGQVRVTEAIPTNLVNAAAVRINNERSSRIDAAFKAVKAAQVAATAPAQTIPEILMNQISEDLPVRAQVFEVNLKRILAEHPDRLFFMGIETDIGESQKAQIMPICKAVDEIKELKDADGKPLFPNLIVRRGKAKELVIIIAERVKRGELNLNNTFIGARKVSVDSKLYDSIKGEGKAWISAIDDSRQSYNRMLWAG